MIRLACLTALLCFSVLQPPPASAQNLFAPVAQVDGRVITRFELDQRARLLALLRAPGDPREQALEALINERLQLQEAERQGIRISESDLLDGMEEFAARTDLSREEFVQALASDGVDEQTFRDFVRAGIAWRRIVRDRFAGAANVTERDIDREIRARPAPSLEVSLSEIIVPANTPRNAARAQSLAPQIASIRSIPAFAAAARDYSASPSRTRGGVIEPLALDGLPGPIANAVRGLQPGEVAGPIQIPNALAFFQLRAIREVAPQAPVLNIDYAAFYLPGGRSPETMAQVAALNAEVQTCDDLYGVAQGLPPSRLQRDTLPPSQIPTDVALELAKLDTNEVSTALTRANGRTLVYLMLCERFYQDEETIEAADRNAVGNALTQRSIGRQAEAYLAELRANATIVTQ